MDTGVHKCEGGHPAMAREMVPTIWAVSVYPAVVYFVVELVGVVLALVLVLRLAQLLAGPVFEMVHVYIDAKL
jgi:hypothetical protein